MVSAARITAGLVAGALTLAPALAATSARAEAFQAGRALVDVQDSALLQRLEGEGLALAEILGVAPADMTAELSAASPAFAQIAATMAEDVGSLRADIQASGRALSEPGPGEVGGTLDPRWLTSPIARFELAGIVNRLDRRDFAALDGVSTCGEIRFLYRLAYRAPRRDGAAASRLPFSLNVVFDVPRTGADCRDAAALWRPATDLAGVETQARFLQDGPLRPDRRVLKQIEVNAQAVRFPSGVETAFGGQALYLLRTFAIQGTGAAMSVVPKSLENTPDLARLKADEALRRDLVAYLRDNVPGIDEGVYALPERFLATKALAVSTFGTARLGNHPFTEILSEEDFKGVKFENTRLVRSATGLIERLDNGTCQGCHQAGATAGFHFLGLDRETSPHNRLKLGVSPHYAAEAARRSAVVDAVAEGREPSRFRPLSTAPAADWSGEIPRHVPAGTGMACLPQGARQHLDGAWACGAEQTCEVLTENARLGVALGQCMPKPEKVQAGVACLAGRIETADGSFQDRFRRLRQVNSFAERPTATQYNCRPARIGVPGGLAYRQCGPDDRAFKAFADGARPAEICGMAGGKSFDACVASGDFATCMAGSVARGMRPTCGRDTFCREDYLCQSLPEGLEGADKLPSDVGYCSPTYFVFQMRVDGHPDPIAGGRRRQAQR
ncbi:MAG TPA: hypothetical protein VIL65_04565 [Beijerinckiaceae bacterium]|jgi:hypothetical protein